MRELYNCLLKVYGPVFRMDFYALFEKQYFKDLNFKCQLNWPKR